MRSSRKFFTSIKHNLLLGTLKTWSLLPSVPRTMNCEQARHHPDSVSDRVKLMQLWHGETRRARGMVFQLSDGA